MKIVARIELEVKAPSSNERAIIGSYCCAQLYWLQIVYIVTQDSILLFATRVARFLPKETWKLDINCQQPGASGQGGCQELDELGLEVPGPDLTDVRDIFPGLPIYGTAVRASHIGACWCHGPV
jgi:hypothetical protein